MDSQLYELRRQVDGLKRLESSIAAARLPAAPVPVAAPLPALAPMFTAEPVVAPSPSPQPAVQPDWQPAPAEDSPQAPPASVTSPESSPPAIEPSAPAAAPILAAAEPTAAPGPSSAATPTPSQAADAARPAPSDAGPVESAGAFDLEKFIGVRGAAWLGAIALAIAGTLFAKYSIENNLIPPALRIAFLILLGLASLVGSEVFFRPRYPATASPVCGAGIAILYAAFFAGHSAYDLFSLPLTFLLMALTTLVAGLLSVRYDSVFISVLGLLGGFATPLLLSTGKDRPIGLFSYILLLDLGFLFISVRKRWTGVVWLSFVATLLLQVAWASKRLSPAKLPIALAVFFLFGIVYFLLPSLVSTITRRSDRSPGEPDPESTPPTGESTATQLMQLGVLAGLAPLLFGLMIAGQRHYVAQWPLLLGYTALLDLALVLVGIRRGQRFLSLAAATSTFLTVALLLAEQPRQAEPLPLWSFSLALLGLASLFNAAGRIHDRWGRPLTPQTPAAETAPAPAAVPAWLPAELVSQIPLELSGFLGLLGLLLYVPYLVVGLHDGTIGVSGQDPLGPSALLLLAAVLWLAERSRPSAGRIAWLAPGFAALLAGSCLLWLMQQGGPSETGGLTMGPDRLLRGLSLPLLLSVVSGLFAARRAQQAASAPHAALVSEVTAAVLAAASGLGVICVSAVGPGTMLPMTPGLGLVFVGLYSGLLWLSALRRDLTALLPLALGLVCAESFTVVSVYHHVGDEAGFLPGLAAYVLVLTAAPLLALALRPVWRVRRGAFLASALAGPALFLPILQLVTDAVGKRAIGLLPLGFALLSVLGLSAVQRLARLPLSAAVAALFPDAVRARRSLGNQALFAACALGFVAVAIPLQLDRQWILIAWAIEAACVWWLYRRLPHVGLKYFGVALYAAVILRLYPDLEFRHLNERGLVVFNWLLYTYGLPAACFLIGARGLQAVEASHRSPWEEKLPVGGARFAWYQLAYLVGLLSVFVLINLEIADAFSSGRYVEFSWEHSYARDLTVSLSWGLYALLLLSIGMWQRSRALRFVSLGFMLLTIGKVFLYDLSNIRGIYRPLSFLGLALSLIVVSLLYQRFVFRREPDSKAS